MEVPSDWVTETLDVVAGLGGWALVRVRLSCWGFVLEWGRGARLMDSMAGGVVCVTF